MWLDWALLAHTLLAISDECSMCVSRDVYFNHCEKLVRHKKVPNVKVYRQILLEKRPTSEGIDVL